MIRNFKTLGLALVAVFAMSAVVASAASAQLGKITSGNGEAVTLTGTEVGLNVFTVNFFGHRTVECPNSTFHGGEDNTTPHTAVPSGATTVTVNPNYVNCKNQNGEATTVHMNGCDYEFSDATTTGGVAGTYGVLTHVVCPAGNRITITTPQGNFHVPAQTIVGFHLTNTPGTKKTLHDVHLSGTAPVTCVNPFGGHSTCQQTVNVTIKGDNKAGEEIGVTVSD